MTSSRCHHLAIAVLFEAVATGTARANDARVPMTGSNQGETVPNVLSGGGPAQGIQPPNSISGSMASSGEAQPHSDVTSPTGLVPHSNRAPRQPGLR